MIEYNENGIHIFDSDYNVITGNKIADNYYGSYISQSNNINVTGNNLTDNGSGITHYNSIGIVLSGNSFTDNWLTDTSVIDSGEVVLATTIYSCGAAALATILNSFRIYATENELATLAGTDKTGQAFMVLKQRHNPWESPQ